MEYTNLRPEDVKIIMDVPLYYRLMIKDASRYDVFKPSDEQIVQTYRIMLKQEVCAYFLWLRGCGNGIFKCDGLCSKYGVQQHIKNQNFKSCRTNYLGKEDCLEITENELEKSVEISRMDKHFPQII